MQKKLLLTGMVFVCAVQQIRAWFEPKSEYELAERLFDSDIALRPSRVNEAKIIKFVCKVKEEALKLKFDEKRVMQLIVDHAQKKMRYYGDLMNQPKKDYKIGAQIFAAGIGLCVAGILIGYRTWTAYCDAPQKIKEVNDNLSRLGAFCISANSDRASAMYYSNNSATRSAIREELWCLMHYKGNADPSHGFLTTYLCELAAPIVTTEGVFRLMDARYSDFYYEKYCFIKNELQIHLDVLNSRL